MIAAVSLETCRNKSRSPLENYWNRLQCHCCRSASWQRLSTPILLCGSPRWQNYIAVLPPPLSNTCIKIDRSARHNRHFSILIISWTGFDPSPERKHSEKDAKCQNSSRSLPNEKLMHNKTKICPKVCDEHFVVPGLIITALCP